MKILHVGEYVQGGVATYIKTLLHHPNEKDIEDYLVLADEKSEHDWPLNSSCIKYYHYKRSLYWVLKTIPKILKIIEEIKPDIIYCHSTWAGVMVRLPYLLKKQHPMIIYNAHGWSFLRNTADYKKKIYSSVEKLLSTCTKKIVNVSKCELESALKYGLPRKKLELIYSGITTDLTWNNDGSNDKTYDSNKINLLFVGRFDPQKGVDLLLDIMKSTKRNDIHLTLIGDNVVDRNPCVKKNNSENVKFIGWVKHEDLGKYYANCDAVIMPSRWEAFGLVAVEAMKYSKPVIASRNGALPELVKDNINGILCDFENGDGLDRLPVNKIDYKIMGENGRKLYIKMFTADKMTNNTIRIYREIMNCY